MKTLAEILKKERIKKKKRLQEVQRKTLIPLKTLIALEQNDFSKLPSAPFIEGFIKIYSDFLGLDPKRMVAIFRRDAKRKDNDEKVIPKSFLKNWQEKFWIPKTGIIGICALIFLLLIFYIIVQLKTFYGLPMLKLDQPKEGEKFTQEKISISGQTKKETSIFINDKLINVDDEGRFNYQFKLFPGENVIVVSAVNRHDKKKIINRKVELVDNSD